MPSNHLIFCLPHFLLPLTFPSIRVFSSELALCIRCPEYWSFSISPSNECSGLISFRTAWFDLLAFALGTLKSLLQHHSSKASVLWHSAFLMVQLLHPYMTTRKAISSVQSLSCVQLLATPWPAACQASLSITNSQSLLKLISIESVMPFNHLILCLQSSCLQSFLASGSFPVSWLFASGAQSVGASASVLLMNIQV